MPVWHGITQSWRDAGRLAVVGLVQEQHRERSRLFAQWQGFDWPILWDPFNSTGSRVVPRMILIDEHGIVRSLRADPATIEAEFLDVEFAAPSAASSASAANPATGPTLASAPASIPADATADRTAADRAPQLAGVARAADDDERRWQRATSELLWQAAAGGADTASTDAFPHGALDELARFAAAHPARGDAAFRLGVAHRLRHDSDAARPGDFQAALDAWAAALALDPNQYIWRRRIQQYGPRLDKPYPFYDWMAAALAELRARGEDAVELRTALTTAERAAPRRGDAEPDGDTAADASPTAGPDDADRVDHAPADWFEVHSAVAWDTSGGGPVAQVHVELHPQPGMHWNNEVEATQVWIGAPALPDGVGVEPRLHTLPLPSNVLSNEVRRLDFEVALPADRSAPITLAGYALAYACDDTDGTCRFVRQDFTVQLAPPKP